MPSKITSWITIHDHLAMLHVSSNDPRRARCQDIAVFEKDLVSLLEIYTWSTPRGFIQNQHGKSLLSVICDARKLGTIQREPNCDFTKDNICRRPAPKVCGLDNLNAFVRDNPNWRQDSWDKRFKVANFPPVRYKKRSEWMELKVPLEDGGTIGIKINKWLVKFVPQRLVFRPMRSGTQLFLLPSKHQRKFKKHDNDHRHGISLLNHILTCIESYSIRTTKLKDKFDYRVDESGDFIGSTNVKNTWHNTELGLVLEVTIPEGHCPKMWDIDDKVKTIDYHIYPSEHRILPYKERKGYFLISEAVADKAQDYIWNIKNTQATCLKVDKESHLGKSFKLKKLVCELSGVAVSNISIAARMSKYYEKALYGTDRRSMRARAKFENALPSEKTTSNKMYVDSKFIHFKKIHCTKHIHIPELNITALDMRIESIRVGGNNE